MRVIADLHVHSRFSRATSRRINIAEIARFAKIKGLKVVGTGDFTHPKWVKELQEDLAEVPNKNLFRPTKAHNPTYFLITGEVSTIFKFEGEINSTDIEAWTSPEKKTTRLICFFSIWFNSSLRCFL